jgi:transposase
MRIICGVDVSSTKLDARIGRDGQFGTFDNDAEGIAALAAFCREQGAELVVMEATGGYERQAFAWLWGHGLEAAIVNPRATRRFAEAMGLLEKTDKIDSGVIAWFAEVKRIEPTPLASEAQRRLTALVVRLNQLTQLKVAQTHQRRLVDETSVLESFTAVLAVVASQTRALEVEVARLIDADPLWAKLNEAFRAIKGVADRTVARVMAQLPEIGLLSGKAIAKLVGLAPIAKDSGKSKGARPVRGGRSGVRSILFVVVEIVRRYDDDFARFRERLEKAGKPKKVIRVALAHKLLVRLNAKARVARVAMAAA